MSRKPWLLLAALGLVVVAAVVAQAPDPPSSPATTDGGSISLTVVGSVVSWKSTELILDTDTGSRMTLVIDPKATPLTGFAAGERVSVEYRSLPDGTFQVDSVSALAPAGSASSSAASSSMPASAGAEGSETRPSSTTSATSGSQTSAVADQPLPRTASRMPLLAALALLAAAAALAFRFVRA